MSFNSSASASASSNNTLLHPNLSSVAIYGNLENCFFSTPSNIIFISFSVTNGLLLFPLCIFILYLGFKRWRQQGSSSTAAMMSHIDSFTYHMVTMELIGVFGFILCCVGIHRKKLNMFMVGYCFASLNWYGEAFFHVLTCVERYLAVVHPITYLNLRSDRGIRIRNISIGCVWLLSTVASCLKTTNEKITLMVDFVFLVSSVIVISFCSLSVLCVLCRPKPGTQDGQAERIDQSKKRAFYSIVAILGVLILRFGWNLGWSVAWTSGGLSCVTIMSGVWFNLPCSLVLPLLFLQRAGILVCSINTK